MQRSGILLGVFVLLLVFQAASAKTKSIPAQAPKGSLDSGDISNGVLGGIVINRTITVLGWDFYKNFSEVWRALHSDTPYTVTIYERPTAKFGSEIWIDYDRIRVFHAFLSPARSATKEVSKQAVNSVYKNVVDINVQRALYSDVDLAPEEM